MTSRSPVVPPPDAARALAAVVLLAGRVGANALADGIGRSLLDLPIGPHRSVLDAWHDQLAQVQDEMAIGQLCVRVAVDRGAPAPRVPSTSPRLEFRIVEDAAEYRGTAGVVKDVTDDLADGDWILVASANQIQVEPLTDLFRAVGPDTECVAVVPDGSVEMANVFVLRRDRLAVVPAVGFMDLKEQAIPASTERPLCVARRPPGSSLSVRTLTDYVRALRLLHSPPGTAADAHGGSAYAESWQPRFALVEDGGDVASSAVLQDAVVLSGGRVEPGAVVARSVVCPGGVVRRGSYAVDAVVTGER